MTDDEINAVVSELLRGRLGDAGFEYATVKSEEDFDGDSIVRVTAHFNNGRVPTARLIDAMRDIRSELIPRGEERFVLLSGKYSDEHEDEDEDEDED
jgi:hypothetical protein